MAKNINIKITGGTKWAKQIGEVLKRYSENKVHVGILGGTYSDGTSIPMVAGVHEFGVPPGTIMIFTYKGKTIINKSGLPPRSWLRTPLHRAGRKILGKKGDIEKMIMLDIQHGYTGVALNHLGNNAKELIHDEFATSGQGEWPRNMNKAYTDLKGHNTPLIDEGTMMNSVDFEVVKE